MAEKEYIEREKALKAVCTWCGKDEKDSCICTDKREILAIPSADVVEVVHGEWISSHNGISPIRCNKCNTPALFVQEQDRFGNHGFYRCPSNYCPNCGAKMDGKDGEGK